MNKSYNIPNKITLWDRFKLLFHKRHTSGSIDWGNGSDTSVMVEWKIMNGKYYVVGMKTL